MNRWTLMLVSLVAAVVSIGWASTPTASRGYLGFANWDCSQPAPHSYVSARLVIDDPVFAYAVAAHEVDHENYMMEFAATCKEWRRNVTDHVRVDMEARAYCVASKVLLQGGRVDSVEQGAVYFARWLIHYPAAKAVGLSQPAAFMAIMSHCLP